MIKRKKGKGLREEKRLGEKPDKIGMLFIFFLAFEKRQCKAHNFLENIYT